jgi:hypothetical protein
MIMDYQQRLSAARNGGIAARAIHDGAHPFDCRIKPTENRFADQEVSDVEFNYIRNLCDGSNGLVGQPVTGMAFEAEILRHRCGLKNSGEFVITRDTFGMAISTSVKLHNRGTNAFGSLKLNLIGRDKERDSNAGVFETRDVRAQFALRALHFEATFSRALFATLRHEAGRVRHMAQRNLEHFVSRSHL